MGDGVEGRFELGDFKLQSGAVIPDAFLGYATHGTLNDARDNVIVYPTWYTPSPETIKMSFLCF